MKNKKIILVIIIFLIVILVAFAGVYAYIALDVFKTPKQLFGKYLDNQIGQVKNVNMGALKTIKDNLKDNTSETELEMKIESEDDETAEVKVGLKRDPANSAGSLTLKLKTNDEELADYELYANKEKLALKIPELNEKFFAIKIDTILEQVEKLAEEKGLTENKIDLSAEKIEKYKKEFTTLYNKYLEDIKTNFTDDKFTAEKNVEVDVNGTNMSANRYTFSLKSQELRDITIDVLTKLSNEPILSDFMSEEQIESFKEAVEDMKDTADIEEDKVLKFCVYEKNGNTVKIEIKVDDDIFGEFMVVKTSDAETDIIANVFNESNNVGCKQTIIYSINVENENTTTVTTKTITAYTKEDVEKLKKQYEDDYFGYYTPEMIEEEYKDSNISQKMTVTLNGEKGTCKLSTDAFKDLGIKVSKMQVNYKFGSQVTFANLEDAINLEDYIDNEEKQAELMLECMKNLQEHPNSLLVKGVSNVGTTGFSSYYEDEDDDDETDFDFSSTSSSVDYGKERIEELISDALDDCLDSYKRDLEEDENTNIADYLTVNKISEMILSSFVSDLELIDGETLKCKYMDEVYYVKLVLNGDTLEVDEATAYTESEYEEL